MSQFFQFFEQQRIGLAVFLATLVVFALLINLFARIFGLGRYKTRPGDEAPVVWYTLVEFFIKKIINEFRHLLALVIVLIFGLVLAAALLPGLVDGEFEKDGLQVVVASLGGLIGSIIGYYFGESAGRRDPDSNISRVASAIQGEGDESGIEPAPPPQ